MNGVKGFRYIFNPALFSTLSKVYVDNSVDVTKMIQERIIKTIIGEIPVEDYPKFLVEYKKKADAVLVDINKTYKTYKAYK